MNPKLPIRTFDALIRAVKAHPTSFNYGTYGVGSLPHTGFEAKAGIKLVHVPYKSGAASYQAAMAGEVQVVAGTSFVDLLKSGQLRGLAIGGQRRSPKLPDIPTLAELGYGENMFGATYLGAAAPAATPAAIIDKLSGELKKISALPGLVERLGKFSEASYASPAALTAMVRRDMNFYDPLVRSLGPSNQ